ncbi:P-loop containing nucleoside triphosphate hydrolase protein [Mycena rebaudengoi]|nr:P-loop containing nucleoside triphosphate hydrolase protein [Mycena rebaudengoi]
MNPLTEPGVTQVVLDLRPIQLDPTIRPATLLIPLGVASLSALTLLVHLVVSYTLVKNALRRIGISVGTSDKVLTPSIGYSAILVYRIARLIGCIGLFALSIACLVTAEDQKWRQEEAAMSLTYLTRPYQLYASLLALLSTNSTRTRQQLIRHANTVLFVAFAVYVYRDVFPLATFTRVPEDLHEGPILWAKISLLFATAIVVPLFTPRQYIPVDPLHPMKIPNPEQTASIIAFAFYFFLDRIVFLGYRNSEIKEEEFYPLCDTDASRHLRARTFPHLDTFSGGKKRHIFFGLMRIFRVEVSFLVLLQVIEVLAVFSSPIAMRQLLRYLENYDESTGARPWVWILLLFFGPTIGALASQLYQFITSRTLVRTEAIITQLVFAHSLRIRMKAETATEKDSPHVERPESRTESDVETIDGAQSTDTESGADTATLRASSSSPDSAASNDSKQDATKAQGSLTSKINNLVTTDLGNIVDSRELVSLVVYVPLQIAICIWFLHSILGWAAWVGLGSILLFAPMPGYMAKLVQSVQIERLKRTDERVQRVSEAVNVLRMVKLFGWETKMKDRIATKAFACYKTRDEELIWVRKRQLLSLATVLVRYTVVMGQPLNASKVFASITVFDLFRYSINWVPGWLDKAVVGKVSLDRLIVLYQSELLDSFDEASAQALFPADPVVDERIGFRNANFSWSKDTDGSLTPSRRNFLLRIEEELIFERGRINLVVGPTGSGKTSLLHALLGEMHWIPSSPDSWYNLPRGAGVAYAAQESWVLNETIKDNIIFDTPLDEERYKKVIYQCALEQDLSLFQAGDQTEVGEKGLTLSGGQKARLTLARAVYSTASILLLDDVLAALDVHTAQWIVEKCFGGDLLKGRTVILVTHNVALARPIAHFIVTFGADGTVKSQGSVAKLARGPLAAQIREDQKALDKAEKEVDAPTAQEVAAPKADGKLIVTEEVHEGHISRAAAKMYLLAMGGDYPVLFLGLWLFFLLVQHTLVVMTPRILGYWARQYDLYPASDVPVILQVQLMNYMTLFIANTFGAIFFFSMVWIMALFGKLRASTTIHKRLIESILSAPLRWLDITPTSRIIARVTNDIRAVDDSIGDQVYLISGMSVIVLARFVAIIVYIPVFVVPALLIGVLGGWVGQVYIAAQLPAKRLMSNARAPVLAHFGAAIAGLGIPASPVSVRAYGAQDKFGVESLSRIDRYTRNARASYNMNRWVSTRIDILGHIFSASLATYLVYVASTSAADTGFVLAMSVTLTANLLWIVSRGLSSQQRRSCSVSLERIQSYVNIEHEKPVTEAGRPPAYWPASGDLRVENLSAKYSDDGPSVLHGVSFHVKSGERVGIVGRTGSGKSSLTLSLLRCIPTEGSIIYDGIDTAKLNLDALRSSITIIPQVPELLSGSLRANLDPFGQYDDVELNSALRAAGLFALQSEMVEGRITLDSAISAGGSNLSVGQRQIFALARAIVRKSKILILDEATSAIADYKTDSIIQTSLREELPSDVSLITVAHRLQTIMDADKIMVLDTGRVVEFDTPKALLKIKDGKLRALVEESGDRNVLYAMAEKAAK